MTQPVHSRFRFASAPDSWGVLDYPGPSWEQSREKMLDEMAAAGWRLGCAAQNIANEATPPEDALATRAHQVFESWLAVLEQALGDGLPPPEARRRAVALLSGLQGARGLARASGSREAFEALKGGAEESDRFRPDSVRGTSGPNS